MTSAEATTELAKIRAIINSGVSVSTYDGRTVQYDLNVLQRREAMLVSFLQGSKVRAGRYNSSYRAR